MHMKTPTSPVGRMQDTAGRKTHLSTRARAATTRDQTNGNEDCCKAFLQAFEGVKEEVMTYSERATKILISDMRYSVHGDDHVSILF
jgi:hypothetical protein